MDDKKRAKVKLLLEEMEEVKQAIATEKNNERKQELLKKQNKLNTKIDMIRNNKILSRAAKRNLVAYSFIAPNFIGFCIFTLVPIIFAFALAFMKWDGNNEATFVGTGNFAKLATDTFFWAALKNTIIYVIGTVPLTMAASLGLAMLLNQRVKGRGFFRTVAFFP